ncbi:hypothetical protein D3C80_1559890 [compost metagenome]
MCEGFHQLVYQRVDFISRRNVIDEAHAVGLLGIDGAAGEGQIQGVALSQPT